jgi:hypothetical protein
MARLASASNFWNGLGLGAAVGFASMQQSCHNIPTMQMILFATIP